MLSIRVSTMDCAPCVSEMGQIDTPTRQTGNEAMAGYIGRAILQKGRLGIGGEMSKIMNYLLIQQELGKELSEIQQKEMDNNYQDEDPDAEKKAESILNMSDEEFAESLSKLPF